MTAYTTMTVKGQITLPAAMRRALQLMPGNKVKISFDGDTISIGKPGAITEVRNTLQGEMFRNGTAGQEARSGDGWAAHVQEAYDKADRL
jgi:AbrB family looped-hinge helix DNA binding protein